MSVLTRNTPKVLDGGPLNAAGIEEVYATLITPSDPTAGAAPEFTTTTGISDDLTGATWEAGSWVADSWDSRTKTSVAASPTLGSTGDIVCAASTNYNLWARVNSRVIYCGVVPFQ